MGFAIALDEHGGVGAVTENAGDVGLRRMTPCRLRIWGPTPICGSVVAQSIPDDDAITDRRLVTAARGRHG